MTLELVPVSRDRAKGFVRDHHRHGKRPPAGEVFRVGVAVDGELVGVALVGLPARELVDGVSLEVTRVCTLGHPNACTRLYGACRRAAQALGWQRLYTYTRVDEPGSSPAAAGFTVDGRVPARDRAVKNGARPRYQENLLGEIVEDEVEKIRWVVEL